MSKKSADGEIRFGSSAFAEAAADGNRSEGGNDDDAAGRVDIIIAP